MRSSSSGVGIARSVQAHHAAGRPTDRLGVCLFFCTGLFHRFREGRLGSPRNLGDRSLGCRRILGGCSVPSMQVRISSVGALTVRSSPRQPDAPPEVRSSTPAPRAGSALASCRLAMGQMGQRTFCSPHAVEEAAPSPTDMRPRMWRVVRSWRDLPARTVPGQATAWTEARLSHRAGRGLKG